MWFNTLEHPPKTLKVNISNARKICNHILYRQKWEYYGGKADPQVYKEKPLDLKILKQDVPIYLEGDEELIESQHTVEYHKAMCDHAEKMCKMLNNRGFQIKNAIDWKRFMEGSI